MNLSDRKIVTLVLAMLLAALAWIAYLSSAVAADSEQTPIIKESVKLVEVIKPIYIHPEPSPISAEPLGEFNITYYTAGYESTGKTKKHPAYGITRSGATVREGVTVAVDPSVIPLGSYLYIEGIGFRVAQDTGGAIKGKDIDIYTEKLSDIPEVGTHPARVYLIKEGTE